MSKGIEWFPIPGGECLGEREGHFAVLLHQDFGEKVVVVAGGYADGECTPHVYTAVVCSIPEETVWEKVAESEHVMRQDATATALPWQPDSALLIGGLNTDTECLLDPVIVTLSSSGIDFCLSHPAGTTPQARSRHTATYVQQERAIFVFGGENDSNQTLCDCFMVVLTNDIVFYRELSLPGLPPRFLSMMCPFGSCILHVGGGSFEKGFLVSSDQVRCLDLVARTVTEMPPLSRKVNGGCAVQLSWGGAVVCGGKDFDQGNDDVSVVLKSERYELRPHSATFPHWRYMPALVLLDTDRLMLICGQCRHPEGTAVFVSSSISSQKK